MNSYLLCTPVYKPKLIDNRRWISTVAKVNYQMVAIEYKDGQYLYQDKPLGNVWVFNKEAKPIHQSGKFSPDFGFVEFWLGDQELKLDDGIYNEEDGDI